MLSLESSTCVGEKKSTVKALFEIRCSTKTQQNELHSLLWRATGLSPGASLFLYVLDIFEIIMILISCCYLTTRFSGN